MNIAIRKQAITGNILAFRPAQGEGVPDGDVPQPVQLPGVVGGVKENFGLIGWLGHFEKQPPCGKSSQALE